MKPITLPKVADQPNYSALDPLDGRYYDPEIARCLSEESRIAFQAYVEAALAHTLADFKICTSAVAKKIEAAARNVTAQAVHIEEQTTKHDIKALVNCIKQQLPEAAQPYVHFGATSYDIVSTAMALQLRTAVTDLLLPRTKALLETLLGLTNQYAHTVQVGRTHGQHAVPITFGFALAEYVSRLGESMQTVSDLSTNLKGKFSGAVGAYNALSVFVDDPLDFEQKLLGRLGLQAAPYSKQIVPAENIVRLLDELAIMANIMANLSHDMRHLQRSEIAEVRERFEHGQTGSSTMAHKRNPWNFENVISMSKQVNAQLINANLNIVSEHQRDLTDSASARFYPVTLGLVASMAERLNRVMGKLEVDTENMQRNLHMSGGAIAAEPLYLLLEKYGHTSAHETSRKLAHGALKRQLSLIEVVQKDKSIAAYYKQFSPTEVRLIAEPELRYTGLAAQKALSVYTYWTRQLSE